MQPHTILYYNPESSGYHWFAFYPRTNTVTYHCPTVDKALLARAHHLEYNQPMQHAIEQSIAYPTYTSIEQDYPELFI